MAAAFRQARRTARSARIVVRSAHRLPVTGPLSSWGSFECLKEVLVSGAVSAERRMRWAKSRVHSSAASLDRCVQDEETARNRLYELADGEEDLADVERQLLESEEETDRARADSEVEDQVASWACARVVEARETLDNVVIFGIQSGSWEAMLQRGYRL